MTPDIPRDRYGRPQIPDPVTGKVRAWTRATTLASTIADRYGLERWAQRNLVRGMALRGEKLLLQAVAAGEDRNALTAVVEAAFEAAESSSSADIGTALHRITERLDAGENVDVPPAYKADIEAYQQAMKVNGVEVVNGWLERFVVVPEVEAAGTADRLVNVDGFLLPLIADLKTGQDALKYGSVEIAAQLAIYSRATHWWDGEKHHPMPRVDQDHALVAHMPAGQGRCDLYLIDLQRGWKIVELCAAARRVRKSKDLARPLVAPVAEEVNSDKPTPAKSDPPKKRDDLLHRVKDIFRILGGTEHPVPWPDGVPMPGEGTWTDGERAQVLEWCDNPRTGMALFAIVASPSDEDDALKARIRDIVRGLEGAPLPVPWPAGVTPPKQLVGAWTPSERARITKWCGQVAPHTTLIPF